MKRVFAASMAMICSAAAQQDRMNLALPTNNDALFRGDRTRYNPEELLLGALSACHMLWVLPLVVYLLTFIIAFQDRPLIDPKAARPVSLGANHCR